MLYNNFKQLALKLHRAVSALRDYIKSPKYKIYKNTLITSFN